MPNSETVLYRAAARQLVCTLRARVIPVRTELMKWIVLRKGRRTIAHPMPQTAGLYSSGLIQVWAELHPSKSLGCPVIWSWTRHGVT